MHYCTHLIIYNTDALRITCNCKFLYSSYCSQLRSVERGLASSVLGSKVLVGVWQIACRMYGALHLEHYALRVEVAARSFAGILASSGAIGESMESKSARNGPSVEGIAGKSVL